jgi:hypothetical protein
LLALVWINGSSFMVERHFLGELLGEQRFTTRDQLGFQRCKLLLASVAQGERVFHLIASLFQLALPRRCLFELLLQF